MKTRTRTVRKLLVATVGVATVSFVGAGCNNASVANLMAPPSCDVAPTNPYCTGPKADASADAGTTDASDAGSDGSAG
jgi:hypothetical protein